MKHFLLSNTSFFLNVCIRIWTSVDDGHVAIGRYARCNATQRKRRHNKPNELYTFSELSPLLTFCQHSFDYGRLRKPKPVRLRPLTNYVFIIYHPPAFDMPASRSADFFCNEIPKRGRHGIRFLF